VEVSFDVRGRDWAKDGKEGNATTLNAWRIEVGTGESSSSSSDAPKRAKATPAAENFPSDPFPNYTEAPPVSTDDLPF
jgi:hypothetical protein